MHGCQFSSLFVTHCQNKSEKRERSLTSLMNG
uniref:Uncharacterized protein n=1 Tax=Arundo donax TaxID=35708 RepID=A0A0A9F1S8_ARUDO